MIAIDKTWSTIPLTVEVENTTPGTVNDWNFGDGTLKAGATQTHSYGIPGKYTITLTTSTGTETVEVEAVEPYTVSIASGTLSIPVAQVDDDDYSAIGMRGLRSTYPTVWYDDGNFPLRTLYFWPVPAQNWAVELWLWQPLDQDVDLDAELNLPPGYERYLRFKLAVELAAEFGKEVPELVMRNLLEAENNIKRLNQQKPLAHASNHAKSAQAHNGSGGAVDKVAFQGGLWMTQTPRG